MLHARKNYSICLLAIVMVVFLSSCGPRVSVSNNAFADMQTIPYGFPCDSTFYIEVPTAGDNRLFTKEVAQKIATVLRNKGYDVVRDAEFADYTLSFTIGMKSFRDTVMVPHYVPGPVKTKRSKALNSEGRWIDSVEETATSGTWVSVEEERLVFKKDFTVRVYDVAKQEKTGDEEVVWTTSVSSSNGSDDLRAGVDYLLLAAFKHFGKNTQKKVYADVESRDVKTLRRLYFRA